MSYIFYKTVSELNCREDNEVYIGEAIGEAKGEAKLLEEKKEIARKLIAQGLSKEIICSIIGLKLNEIN